MSDSSTIGRNDPCHCGSGKKYKKCCIEKDEQKYRKEREKAALNAAKVLAEEAKKSEKEEKKNQGQPAKSHEHTNQSWLGKMANKAGFFQKFSQRKSPTSNKGG